MELASRPGRTNSRRNGRDVAKLRGRKNIMMNQERIVGQITECLAIRHHNIGLAAPLSSFLVHLLPSP